MVVGKALANLANPEQFTNVLPTKICIVKLQVEKNSLQQMNAKQIAEISQGTHMAKGQPQSAHHFSGLQLIDYGYKLV